LNNAHLDRFSVDRFRDFGVNFWLVNSELWGLESKADVAFLDFANIGLETLADVSLSNVDLCEFEFIFGQDTLDIVAELHNYAVGVDVRYKTHIFFSQVSSVNVEEERVFGGFEYFLVIRDFDDLVPLVEAHDSEPVALLALFLSVDFKVAEWDNFINITDCNTDFLRGHDLVPFEIVVFFHEEFLNALHVTLVHLCTVDEKFPLPRKEGFLSFLQIPWPMHFSIQIVLRLVALQVDVLFR
jgi:hypothetical protein